MPSGWVGVLTCELHFPEAHSLKEKRHHLRSAKAQLQNRVGASVAEVDHHDAWQLARAHPAWFGSDGVHPSIPGYKVRAKLLASFIRSSC